VLPATINLARDGWVMLLLPSHQPVGSTGTLKALFGLSGFAKGLPQQALVSGGLDLGLGAPRCLGLGSRGFGLIDR
jgi:hypothetical protein